MSAEAAKRERMRAQVAGATERIVRSGFNNEKGQIFRERARSAIWNGRRVHRGGFFSKKLGNSVGRDGLRVGSFLVGHSRAGFLLCVPLLFQLPSLLPVTVVSVRLRRLKRASDRRRFPRPLKVR